MKLIRSLMLCLAATVALLAPSAHQPAANAQAHGHARVYYVYYRSSAHSAWYCYGGYYQADRAAQAVNWFRSHGYDCFYR